MSPIHPFCKCGEKAQSRKKGKKHYIKCTFCNRTTKPYDSVEEARKVWVKERGSIRWY